MRKIYLSIFLFGLGGVCVAQQLQRAKAERNFAVSSPAENNQNNQRGGSSRAIIWSDDFSNPSNWVMSNTSSPATDWVITNTMPSNLTSQGFSKINSTSGGNFAIIDSDGPGPSASQDANLTTASPINLSAYTGVLLQFQQSLRRYRETYLVQISTDSVTWTDYPVNTDIATNTNSPNPDFVSVNITPTAQGQDSVWIRFNYKGQYDWFWMIDDVALVEAPDNDIKITGISHTEYSKTPVKLTVPITFSANISNEGGKTQNNVRLNVNVNNGLFNNTSAADSLPVAQTLTSTIPQEFTPVAIGEYTIIFNAIQDEIDSIPVNNIDTAVIEVTDTIYARDNNNYTGSGTWNGPDGYEIGNMFYVNKATNATSISFVLQGNTNVDQPVRVRLNEIDATGAFVPVAESDFYVIKSEDVNSAPTTTPISVTIPLIGQPIELKDTTFYIASVEYMGGDTVVLATGTDIKQPIQTSFLFDMADNTWYYITSTPMVRLNIERPDVSIKESEISLNTELYPNPASGFTYLSYELPSSANVTLKISDIAGKEVINISEGNKTAGNHVININTVELTNGVYFYTLTAGNATVTKKLVVVK